MRGGAPYYLEVSPMDMEDVLTLMISFGMLIAFIMSDKNKK